jgi:hypothetical protein
MENIINVPENTQFLNFTAGYVGRVAQSVQRLVTG